MKINNSLRQVCGIYKITNLINKKCYIGSAVNVYNRFHTYKHLIKKNKLHNKHLSAAINKYGLNNFTFEVIKICSKDISIKDLHYIEQDYINEVKPEYNKRIVVDTNHLISHSDETKKKLSIYMKEAIRSGERIVNRIQTHNIKVSLFDLNGNHIQDFPGLAHCGEFLQCNYASVGKAIKSKRRRIKQYIVLRTEDAHLVHNFINLPKSNYSKSVTIIDIVTGQTIKFLTHKQCAIFIKCKVDTLKVYYKNKKVWKNRYKIIKYE
jgi:group I intron endonuclease